MTSPSVSSMRRKVAAAFCSHSMASPLRPWRVAHSPSVTATCADRVVVVGVAQHAVGVQRVAAAAAVLPLLDERAGEAGRDDRGLTRVAEQAGHGARFAQAWRSRARIRRGPCAASATLSRSRTRSTGASGPTALQRGAVLLECFREVVGRQMQIADRLMLAGTGMTGTCRMSQIGGIALCTFEPSSHITRLGIPAVRLRDAVGVAKSSDALRSGGATSLQDVESSTSF